MKLPVLSVLVSVLLLTAKGAETESLDAAMQRAAGDYSERSRQAAEELSRTRQRIADEKAPLLKQMRSAEDRIITATSQIQRLESAQETSLDQRRMLQKNFESIRKNASYLSSLVHDSAKAFDDGLAPGEAQSVAERLQALQQKVDEQTATGSPNAEAAVELAEFLAQRTELAVGGYSFAGSAVFPPYSWRQRWG